MPHGLKLVEFFDKQLPKHCNEHNLALSKIASYMSGDMVAIIGIKTNGKPINGAMGTSYGNIVLEIASDEVERAKDDRMLFGPKMCWSRSNYCTWPGPFLYGYVCIVNII